MGKKILAVDLGITSFGYAVLEEIEENIYRCLDNAVVMRDSPYNESGESTQHIRSLQRSQRRLNEKKKKRIKCIAKVFDRFGLLPYEEALKVNRENRIKNRWKLRAVDAWQRRFAPEELFAIFAHMAKHRGYKSIATEDLLYELELELGLRDIDAESAKKGDERSQVYAALNRLEELKKEYDSETIAQVIHRAVAEGKFRSYRNHDDYEKMIRREDIEEEIEKIVLKQAELGAFSLPNEQIGALIDALKECITDQEMPTNDLSLFGKCTFYKEESAAPKYSYLYDIYRLYKKLADLRIDNYAVTIEDRKKIIEWVEEKIKAGKSIKQLTYKDIRKILGLADDQKIFGQDDERLIKGKKEPRVFVPFFFLSSIAKFKNVIAAIQKHPDAHHIFKKLAEIIQYAKTPQEAYKKIKELLHSKDIEASDAEIVELFKNKKPGTLSLSHRYILQALPYFLEGMDEKGVQRQLGLSDSEDYSLYPKSLKHLHLGHDNLFEAEENTINNHAVKSLASWALGLIADLSWRYGPFDEIVLETARDALPKDTKRKIERAMKEREKALDEIIKKYQDQFPTIDRRLARKIQLWEQQKELDLYTGQTIRISDLLNGNADIEHIVPRSLGGLSTAYNTIVALKNPNVQKGNRLPGEWLAGDEKYRNRVEMLKDEGLIDWKKYKNLLATSLDEVYVENMHSKGIRATSYLEALVAQVLKRHYPFPDPKARKYGHNVRMIPGRVTSKVRSLLNVKDKSRDSNFHHAEDALILATVSRGWQNRLHRLLKENYGKSEEELQKLWQKHLPYIEGMMLADYVDEAYRRFMSKGEESLFYRDMFGGIRSVSYWVNKKPLSASSHKDTVYSPKHDVPTLRKSILEAFRALDVMKNRHKMSADEFMEKYDKEIRQKLWLHHIGNTKDAVYQAIEKRAKDIANTLTDFALKDAKHDKSVDEAFQAEVARLLNEPIVANGKQVRRVRFVYDKLNAIPIDRGLVETDKNMMGIFVEKGAKDKLLIHRLDVNNFREFTQKSGMLCYLNEMLFFFGKRGVMHYGCLRSYVETSKKIALFNPRFPANPKAQPSKFSTGSQIRQVAVGSAQGIIKVHLDFDGHVKSYEVYGNVTPEQLAWFRKESGYGGMENTAHHEAL